MSRFHVTIKDIVIWTVEVPALDAIVAEDCAWKLFQRPDRSEHFEDESDTTVQVEPLTDNESTTHAH